MASQLPVGVEVRRKEGVVEGDFYEDHMTVVTMITDLFLGDQRVCLWLPGVMVLPVATQE